MENILVNQQTERAREKEREGEERFVVCLTLVLQTEVITWWNCLLLHITVSDGLTEFRL
jgi:hypothetical protein